MRNTPLIVLAGRKGSGKSTVAERLVSTHGAVAIAQADPMKRFALRVGVPAENLWGATDLREQPLNSDRLVKPDGADAANACAALSTEISMNEHALYVTLKNWYADTYEKAQRQGNFTARWFLQQLGTECVRSSNPNTWTDTARSASWKLLSGGYAYTEQHGLAANGSEKPPSFVVITDGRFANEILAVKRVGGFALLLKRASTGSSDTHASETSLDLIPSHWWDETIVNDGTIENLKDMVSTVIRDHFSAESPWHAKHVG